MRLSNFVAATAALSMIAIPAFAAPANPAAKLSLNKDTRAGAKVKDGNRAKGGGATYLYVAAGLALVVIGAVALGHNDSKPASS